MALLHLKIEFGGGLELLFSNQRSHRISLPSDVPTVYQNPREKQDDLPPAEDTNMKPADVHFLLRWLRDNLLKERAELFMDGETVCVTRFITCCPQLITIFRRPGVLILINDTDWELEGEGDYQLKDGDEVVFISTLHGG